MWGLIIWLATMPLIEYIAHRWLMHKPTLGKKNWAFWTHAVLHHKNNDMTTSIDITPVQMLVWMSWLWIPVLFISWFDGLVLMALYCFYGILWSMLHRCHHDLGFSWLKRVPGYKYIKRHHLLHHDHPTKNYGAVFIFTDYLFGTKI